MSVVVWWIRRDLRLFDNEALHSALAEGLQLLPLFIVDPFFENSDYVAEKRGAFLWQSLAKLDQSLQKLGGRLIVRRGSPTQILPELVQELEATAVFAEEDYSPYACRRDKKLKTLIPLKLVSSLTYHHPNDILKGDGKPYVVYSHFKKQWLERPLPHKSQIIPVPKRLPALPQISSDPLPDLGEPLPLFPPGEAEAQRRLADFANGAIWSYKAQRNIPGIDGTSQLSPYLRFGLISARVAVETAVSARAKARDKAATKSAQTWLDELIWREFYIAILHHFPHVAKGNFRSAYDGIQWRNDQTKFEAWCQGQTGYPIVDAAMRQLLETGWMHNRCRMIVASFLVKDCLIDWRLGERWFMQNLVDGDLAANNGGWQWTAGTGTDAAPYFRIFNPTTQSEKFDPKGEYIRRFVPELANYPDKEIHNPSKVPPMIQRQYQCVIGQDYPAPVVNRKEARDHTLAAYKLAKEGS